MYDLVHALICTSIYFESLLANKPGRPFPTELYIGVHTYIIALYSIQTNTKTTHDYVHVNVLPSDWLASKSNVMSPPVANTS